jgi:hypothetical protein
MSGSGSLRWKFLGGLSFYDFVVMHGPLVLLSTGLGTIHSTLNADLGAPLHVFEANHLTYIPPMMHVTSPSCDIDHRCLAQACLATMSCFHQITSP